jgi:hypothetical protein
VSLSGLFNRRVRGFRVVEVVGWASCWPWSPGVYLAKTFAWRERQQITASSRKSRTRSVRKRLLEAEVAHLEQPRRIEQLALMMQLKPIAPDHEITEDALIDVARRRELPRAPISPRPSRPRPWPPTPTPCPRRGDPAAAGRLRKPRRRREPRGRRDEPLEPGSRRLPIPAWRWLIERVWRLEHAFERSRAAAKPEDDTRIRIFLVMGFFSLCFVGVGWARLGGVVLARGQGNGYAQGVEGARGDLVDRNGKLLAVDLTHYALYVDPKEVWDAKETRRALGKALPHVPAKRLDKAVFGDRRAFVMGGMTPDEKDAIFNLGLPGISFEEQERRMYPLGATAAHLVGFVDSGGKGLAGAEGALDNPIRKAATGGAVPRNCRSTCASRRRSRTSFARRRLSSRPRAPWASSPTSTPARSWAWPAIPTTTPTRPAMPPTSRSLNRAAASVYEMGSTFKAFTVAIGLDTGVATPASTFDAREPFKLGYRTIHDYHAAKAILTLVEVFKHSSNIGTAMLAERIGGERLSHYFTALGLTKPAQVELRSPPVR